MLSNNLYSLPDTNPPLPEECSVYLANISLDLLPKAYAWSLLNSHERTRAAKFRAETHRSQYIQCHALLRLLLAEHSGVSGSDLSFSFGEFDKPALDDKASESGIKFNLSHSGELAAIAITQGMDVGIDIERKKPGRNLLDIATHFFAPSEQKAINSLVAAEQEDAFYSCWSRKESFIKATGHGLHIPLDRFVVNVQPNLPAELLSVDFQDLEVSQWRMFSVDTPPGYSGALTLGV